ncbi:alpha-D-ribose 1-methylphosphonate 5-triphosphate diphosphatase, partial [Rhodomicrobium vannielii ATCC 17100]|nr:alpha-D-ribose 1-methylphosphonate 5-triphosphate diphosphatase [Rhodomicrobium vannielii ATCC 17100]
MSANELILTNANIVLADRVVKGTLTVKGAVIAGIYEGVSHLPAAIDCEGDLILPGLVELHTDNIERHMMPRPGAAWPVRSAALSDDRELAASGITTVFNAICVGEVHSRSARSGMVADIAQAIDDHIAAGTLKIDHYFHWRCEVSYPGLPDLLDPLIGNAR